MPRRQAHARAVAAHLAALPSGAVLRWRDGDADADAHGAQTGMVEVIQHDLMSALGLAWIWTVVEPGRESEADLLTLPLPYDRTVDVDGEPCGAWSSSAISAALGAWAREHAGADVRFVFDPQLPPGPQTEGPGGDDGARTS